MTSTRTTGQIALMKEERVGQASREELYDGFMFEEEIRRANKYDEEVCPPEHQSMLQYVVSDATVDVGDVLLRFGKRYLPKGYNEKDISAIIETHNFVESQRGICGDIGPLRHGLGGGLFDYTKRIKNSDVRRLRKSGKSGNFFVLPEVREGFSFVFGEIRTEDEGLSMPLLDEDYKAFVYGLPDVRLGHSYEGTIVSEGGQYHRIPFKMIPIPKDETAAFWIGNLCLDQGLIDIAPRRFNYIFGCPPASEGEVIDALVRVNKLEDHGTFRGRSENSRAYKLVEKKLGSLKAPRAAHLVFDEAVQAKKAGLFRDVKAYELVAREHPLPKRDPVIIGVDRFGQWYPIIYWAMENEGKRRGISKGK
ncbi:MAG: hypothetical protein ABIG28_01775 [archaeon]